MNLADHFHPAASNRGRERLDGIPVHRSVGQLPSWLAMAYGFIAASGLTLLTYAALTDRVKGGAALGFTLFAVVADGGVVMNPATTLLECFSRYDCFASNGACGSQDVVCCMVRLDSLTDR